MRLLCVYSAIAAVMFFVSFFAKDREAVAVAALLGVSHIVGAMAWISLPLAPATLLQSLGYSDFTHTETRAVMDGAIATWVAYRCLQFWWGKAILAALIATGFAHVMRQNYHMPALAYAFALNGLFLVMATTLLRIGGGGALQYVGSVLHRCARGNVFRSPKAAPLEARKG